jgi:hypothetical protein
VEGGGLQEKQEEGDPNHPHDAANIHPVYQGDDVGEIEAEMKQTGGARGATVVKKSSWDQIVLFLQCNYSAPKLVLSQCSISITSYYYILLR